MNGLGLKDGYMLFLLVIVGKKYVHNEGLDWMEAPMIFLFPFSLTIPFLHTPLQFCSGIFNIQWVTLEHRGPECTLQYTYVKKPCLW